MRDRIVVVLIVGGFLTFGFVVGMFQGIPLSDPDYLQRVLSREHLARSLSLAVLAAGFTAFAFLARKRIIATRSQDTTSNPSAPARHVALLVGIVYLIAVEAGSLGLAAIGFSPPVTPLGLSVDMVLWNAAVVGVGSAVLWILLPRMLGTTSSRQRFYVFVPTLLWYLVLLSMAIRSSIGDCMYVLANAAVVTSGLWLATSSLVVDTQKE